MTVIKQQFKRVRVRGKLTRRLMCWNSFNRQNVTFNKTSEIHVFKSWFSSLHLMYYFKHGSQQVYFSLMRLQLCSYVTDSLLCTSWPLSIGSDTNLFLTKLIFYHNWSLLLQNYFWTLNTQQITNIFKQIFYNQVSCLCELVAAKWLLTSYQIQGLNYFLQSCPDTPQKPRNICSSLKRRRLKTRRSHSPSKPN